MSSDYVKSDITVDLLVSGVARGVRGCGQQRVHHQGGGGGDDIKVQNMT